MKRTVAIVAHTLLLTPALTVASPAAATFHGGMQEVSEIREANEPTTWFGGFGRTGGDRPQWTPTLVKLHPPRGDVLGTMEAGSTTIVLHGKFHEGQFAAQAKLQGEKLEFTGELKSDAIVGTCHQGNEEMDFHLLPCVVLTGKKLDRWCGLFQLAPDHQFAIIASDVNMAVDFQTGEVRALRARSNNELTAGPLLVPQLPVTWKMRTDEPHEQMIHSFVMERAGKEPQVATRIPFEQEEFRYHTESDGVEIVGTLYLPPGEGPHPAMVFVHGSGRVTREAAMYNVPFLIGQGFAVLAVDKRGVGESGGKYKMPDGGSDGSPAHFRRRAGDVRSAIHALKEHPRIDSDTVGLFGISQAGWVMPIAAADPGCAFTISLSGGAAPVSQEGVFSRLARESETGSDLPSIESLLPRVRKVAANADTRADFAAQSCPGLWLYGLKDRSNPSQLCVELLESVTAEHDKDFTIVTFENANHPLMVCRYGGKAETVVSTGMVPGAWQAIEEWLVELEFAPLQRGIGNE